MAVGQHGPHLVRVPRKALFETLRGIMEQVVPAETEASIRLQIGRARLA